MSGKKILKRVFAALALLLLLLVILLVGLFFALRSPKVQTFIAQKVTETVSKNIDGDVSIGDVSISFFNNITLNDILVEDNQPDTLAYIGNIDANFSYFSLFQRKITLDNVVASDVQLDLVRSFEDTTFNFQQLFHPVDESTSTAMVENQPWQIDFRDFRLTNVSFSQSDALKGADMNIAVAEITGSFYAFDISNRLLELAEVNLIEPRIQVKSYPGNDSISLESEPFLLNVPFEISSDQIRIENGLFTMVNNKIGKDVAHQTMNFQDIEVYLEDTYVYDDSLFTSIKTLETREEEGFEVQQMTVNVALTNQKIALDSLLILTGNSRISNNASLTFNSFESFKNFNNDVRFSADFERTKIAPEDIAFFTNLDISAFKYPVEIDGRISGKVSNLKGRELSIRTGKRTLLEGKFSLNGLPNLKETFISFDLKRLNTDYDDIISIYPKLPLPSNLRQMGNIYFTGKFDGFINDFVTYGKVSTALGDAATDVNFKLSPDGESSYSGNLTMDAFKVGEWLGIDGWLGAVSLESTVEGKGLKVNTLDASLQGTIREIEINDYSYRNLIIDGSIKDKFFQGKANIDDDNMKFDFSGLIDATKKIPRFEFEADLHKLDLRALNLMEKPYSVSGRLTSNFSASSIDDVLGSLYIDSVVIGFEEKNYTFEKIALESNLLTNGEKQIRLETDNISALAEGDFRLTQLPIAVKKIFVPYDTTTISDQEIRFDFALNNNSQLLEIFVPEVRLPKQANIGGNLNTKKQSLFVAIDIPFLQYKNFSVSRLNSNLSIQSGTIDMITSLPVVYSGDSVLLEDVYLTAEGDRQLTKLKLNTNTFSEATAINIAANVTSLNNSFMLSFEPSTILLNNTFWNFTENNRITFSADGVRSENLRIESGASGLDVFLNMMDGESTISTELNNIELNDFTDFLQEKDIDLWGRANGKITVDNLKENPAFSGDLIVDNIEINNYQVGTLGVQADLDLPSKKVAILGNLVGNESDIDISGTYSFAPRSTPKDLDITFNINQFAIKAIEDFIPEYIDNTKGTVSGIVSLKGHRNKPDLSGFVDINDVTTTVTYLQTTYNVKNERVTFDRNAISLGSNLKVTDLEGNVAYGSGQITHNHLKDLAMDIQVVSEKIIGLNTTVENNELYYGIAYIKGGVSFSGPVNDVTIFVYGESEPNTVIEIPMDDVDETSQYSFYNFIKKEKNEDLDLIESDVFEEAIKIKGVTVKLDLDIDQDCEVRLILDQAAGDILEAKGNGNITIDVANGGDDVDFYGNYLISGGNYLFTLQNIINKKFRIEPNSSIKFNGPIDDAVVDVNAIYNLRTSTYSLIQDILTADEEEKIADAKNRVPVSMYLQLTDRLSAPTIKFDIQVSQLDPNIRNEVDTKLQNIRLYENELNRQVFGLLVLGQFLPSSSSQETQAGNNLVATGAANTVSEFFSSQISRYFNDLISSVVPGLDVNFNYSSYNQNNTDADDLTLQNRRELQLLVSQRFLNDRITLNLGGNVDFGEDNLNPGSTATFFGGDFSFEYAFTKSRNFRIKAFTNTDYDYFSQNNRTRAGLGLSYKKEFDKIKELKITKEELQLRNAPKNNSDTSTTPQIVVPQ